MRIRADLLSTPPRLDPVAAYLAAAACAVAAGLVGAILGSFYEGVAPFATFYPAIFLAAFVGGFGPGAVCCLLSWALAWWLWIREGGTVESGGINFLLFTASALLLAAAADFVRKILARLAASERRFKAAQEASLDPFLILSAVRDEAGEACDFRIAFANAAAARSLGDSVEGLTGRRLSEVRAAVLGKPGIFARYREVLDTGMAHLAEIPYRDGDAAGWVRNQAVRLEDGLAVTYRDVTEARERQEALAERAAGAQGTRRTGGHLRDGADRPGAARQRSALPPHQSAPGRVERAAAGRPHRAHSGRDRSRRGGGGRTGLPSGHRDR